MSKGALIPTDPALRKEYFQRFSATALYDAHFLAVYIDEYLAPECGMVSPTYLLSGPPYASCGYVLNSFTSNQLYSPESLAPGPMATNVSVLTADPALYFGFWGRAYNAVLDAAPPETYNLISEFVQKAQANLTQVQEAFVPDDQNPKPPKLPPVFQACTTMTDSQAKNQLIDVHELQGSVRRFECGRGCCTELQELDPAYRFPVGEDGKVAEVATAVGQDPRRPGYAIYSPLQGAVEREMLILARPVKKKPVVEKKAEKEDKGKKKKKTKKTKKALDPLGYPKRESSESTSSGSDDEPQTVQLKGLTISSTQPKCKFCGAPLRFGIQGVKVPPAYKSYVSAVSKIVQVALQPAQQTVTSNQHNDYQTKKTQSLVKTPPNLRFVLLEIGFNRAFAKIHEENLRSIMQMKGAGVLIRIAKPGDENAAKFSFEGMEAAKTNLQLGPDFALENLCYLIETENIRYGINELMEVYKDRYLWVADWDDMKKRGDKYFPKKK